MVTIKAVDDIFKRWRGNKGGRCSLYTLIKAHGITVDEAYCILTMDHEAARRKARSKRSFVSGR